MKKTIALISLLAALLLFPVLVSAQTVVTSFYPIYLLTVNLTQGIEEIEVHNLTSSTGGCLHDYQLSTADMKALSEADVFLINGAGMESFLDLVTEAFPELPVVDASVGIALLPDESGESLWNAHVWLDVRNAQQMLCNLCDGLREVWPEYADALTDNRDAYFTTLSVLDEDLRLALADVPRKDIITFHEAFPYFAQAYGLNVAAVVALDPEDSLSPKRLATLIDTVRSLNNPPLFTEPQYESLAAETIAAETGAKIYELDPVVTGPLDNAFTYYEDTMRRNL